VQCLIFWGLKGAIFRFFQKKIAEGHGATMKAAQIFKILLVNVLNYVPLFLDISLG
jgi:hypothetical protein